MLSTLHPLLASNPIQPILNVFHPLLKLFGWILAGLYAVWPNYGFAIAGLTVIIMLALTPITVKSTRSMIAMQRLQPEMKKLQAKYKGPENRELLNQEMMRLYKENGTSPFGACLPPLLQMPFLIVLYSLIRDLSKTTATNSEYLPPNSQMHHALVASHGQMHWWFGMDLSSSPLSHHGFPGILPYLALIAIAVFLQYYQMKQMNSRNPQAAAANPQMQTMQKIFPLLFAVIYIKVPAGATIYMVVSSAMRIGTQDIMFRTGMVTPVTAEREIGSAKDEKEKEKEKEKEQKPPPPSASKPAAKKKSTATDGTSLAKGTVPPKAQPGSNGRSGGNGKGPSGKAANGKSAADSEAAAPKQHPRSRSKRARKAR
ncbi:MAG TPA: YidC/Oxa1 family membrane protein insertase [Acidimicrobiales bacterium]|nr:YidC/Oxa1 family membrane protein insertase [Acidimicrobiales bacterium]